MLVNQQDRMLDLIKTLEWTEIMISMKNLIYQMVNLRSTELNVPREATEELGTLALNDEDKARIAEARGIKALLFLLSPCSVKPRKGAVCPGFEYSE